MVFPHVPAVNCWEHGGCTQSSSIVEMLIKPRVCLIAMLNYIPEDKPDKANKNGGYMMICCLRGIGLPSGNLLHIYDIDGPSINDLTIANCQITRRYALLYIYIDNVSFHWFIEISTCCGSAI
jgi:hypothetical protein